jgi:hypothetical protein
MIGGVAPPATIASPSASSIPASDPSATSGVGGVPGVVWRVMSSAFRACTNSFVVVRDTWPGATLSFYTVVGCHWRSFLGALHIDLAVVAVNFLPK